MSGGNTERELVNLLREEGIPSLRIPASGGATDRELPDVLIRAENLLVAGEVKYTNGKYIYVEREEVESLVKFANRWYAVPALIPRFSYDTDFYFIPCREIPGDMLTGGDRVSVRRDEKDSFQKFLPWLEEQINDRNSNNESFSAT